MPFNSAQEAYDEYLRTGHYANHAGAFGGTPEEAQAMFGEYKHMIPKEKLKAFREGVAQNEANAIEGMMEGQTREDMGIQNVKMQNQALWRRLGMGLGTGLDMNKDYNWDAGTAREVGTTDLAKWNTLRGVTGTERQRWNDFRAAGSPEAYWSQFRQRQIDDLVNRGAIARDAQGYYNPGPGAGDRYGPQLQGYNFGAGPLGPNAPRANGMGIQDAQARMRAAGPAPAPRVPSMPAPPSPTAGTGTIHTTTPRPAGMPSNTGITGGMGQRKNDGFGVISAADGYFNPNQPPGPLPGGGTPMVVHPGEQVSVTPAGLNPNIATTSSAPPNFPFPTAAAAAGVGQNRPAPGTTREIGPGQAGIPSNMPNGRSPFESNPMPMPTGTGIVWGPNGPTGPGGGSISPNLPGIDMPGHIPMTGWHAGTPWGSGLQSAGQMDNQSQNFALRRAMGEYAGSFGPEQTLMNFYGQALGVDPRTGQPLQGQALDASNRASFGMLAPQAQRLGGDQEAAIEAIKMQLPPGGARDAAIADAIRGGQSEMLGLRQNQAAEARQGLAQIMAMKKGFDPAAYQGGNQALLGAELNARGQDLSTLLGQRGQDIDAMLGQRGQDVQWGLGWGGLANSASQNLWDSYFTGRGQDLSQYANLRGQDLTYQAQQQALRAQREAQDKSWWQQLTGTLGGLVGMANPLSGIFGGGGRSSSGSGGFGLGA